MYSPALLPKSFVRFVWFVLINIFLVIIAGSVVRTTQSGMGCPDWPTCFGSAIPPTDTQQVVFQPQHIYKKGQFIIYRDSLKYAIKKFESGSSYSPNDWKQYEKHNYATFSVFHTWIEYLNRLLGALLGIFVLAQFVWSCLLAKKTKSILWLSFGLVLLTGFQAWLGKTVVDSNLALLKISLHMFGALCMVCLSVYILFIAKGKQMVFASKPIVFGNAILAVMAIVQLLMGTAVRAQIDAIALNNNYINRSGWIDQLNVWFYIHRSFSLIVAALVVYVYVQSKAFSGVAALFKRALFVIIAEILVGVVLTYAEFPAAAQPVHLLLSSVLIALVFNNLLTVKRA